MSFLKRLKSLKDKKILLSSIVVIAILIASTFLYVLASDNQTLSHLQNNLTNNLENNPKTNMQNISDKDDTAANIPDTDIADVKTTTGSKTAIFANGCFWCAEHDLEKVKGVISVESGYTEGNTDNPTYKNYGAGGHREAVIVTYDPNIVSYANLVEFTLKHGDPTDPDGSYYDRGFQYSPAIYFATDEEKNDAKKIVEAVNLLNVFEKPVTISIVPRVKFWLAEDYHQDYGSKNPIRYTYYRNASGRDAFIKKYWGDKANEFTVSEKVSANIEIKTAVDKNNVSPSVEKPATVNLNQTSGPKYDANSWVSFVRPSDSNLKSSLSSIQYEVTQEEGTERPFANEYDKNYEEGIYVDIVSGEPLFFSKDKFDSGTGWPSFVKPIAPEVLVLKEDRHFFSVRTEVRSRYADSHLGHVFDDGPKDRGGLRYCMNSAAMRFIPRADMEKLGYGYLITEMEK